MPKLKIDYGNMLFYKVYCINPDVKKIFVGHTTNIVQRKHVLKKQTEIRYLEMFDVINKNGGWSCWRIKEIEKYNECKTYSDVLLREKYHYDMVYNSMMSTKNETNMKIMDGEKYKNELDSDKYKCSYCNYECIQKKHFQQHITTRKHKNMVEEIERTNEYVKKMNDDKENIKVESESESVCVIPVSESNNVEAEKKEYNCIACGKNYKNMSGLCKHRHICKKKILQKIQEKEDVSKTTHNEYEDDVVESSAESTELVSTVIPEKEKDEIIIQLLKDNESMKTFMKEQNNMLKEMMRQINTNGGSSTITTTNNIKQKFNINIFLNEQCKDAINMGDFIKSLKICCSGK